MIGDDHDKACGGNCGCKQSKTLEVNFPMKAAIPGYEDKPKNIHKYTGYEDIDDFLDDCLDTMRKKGHDYRQGNDDDLLHNFRTVSESVGTDIEKVWFTYFYKHYSAMVTFIKEGGQSESEPIEGRIKDQIVYLLLFYRMVQERKKKAVGKLGEIYKQAEASERNFRRLKKLHEENEAQIKGALAEERLKEIRVSNAGTVDKANHAINIDVNRVRRLAGIEGTFVPAEILTRAGEINKELMERAKEMKHDYQGAYLDLSKVRRPPLGTSFDDLSKTAQAAIVAEAIRTAEPLIEDTGDHGLDGEDPRGDWTQQKGE